MLSVVTALAVVTSLMIFVLWRMKKEKSRKISETDIESSAASRNQTAAENPAEEAKADEAESSTETLLKDGFRGGG